LLKHQTSSDVPIAKLVPNGGWKTTTDPAFQPPSNCRFTRGIEIQGKHLEHWVDPLHTLRRRHQSGLALLSKTEEPMASWLLDCKNCREAFTYSLVPDMQIGCYLPSPPAFPPQGRERECPRCKIKATYQQTDLRFQNERSSRPISVVGN
jgi:hypothetical protein